MIVTIDSFVQMDLLKTKYPVDSSVYESHFISEHYQSSTLSLSELINKTWLAYLIPISTRSTLDLSHSADVDWRHSTIFLLNDESLDTESLLMLSIVHYLRAGSLPTIHPGSFPISMLLRILSWFSPGKANIVLYRPHAHQSPVRYSGSCFSAWCVTPRWMGEYHFAMSEIDDSINGDEQILLTDKEAHPALFDALLFDKAEFKGHQTRLTLIGVVAVVLKYERHLSHDDLSRRVLHLGNIYATFFTAKDVEFVIGELFHAQWIFEVDNLISLTSPDVYYRAATYCFPLFGLVALTMKGIASTINANLKSSSVELTEAIHAFEELIPIIDLIHVPYTNDHSQSLDEFSGDALDKTLTLLVEQNILDIDNVDKFSGWWDVDQPITSGVQLYFKVNCATWPRLDLILAEPARLLIQSALEVLCFMSRAERVSLTRLNTLLDRTDPFRRRTIDFCIKQELLSLEDNILAVTNLELLTQTVEKLTAFDM